MMSDTQDTLIERLREESQRLSGYSLDRGSVDAGIASNLADEAATALADRDAKIAEMRAHSHQRGEDLRTLSAQVAELTQKLERAREALTALFAAIDAGRMVERGAGGMTIEAQMKRSVYNDVPAWPVEEAREKCAFLNSGASQNG